MCRSLPIEGSAAAAIPKPTIGAACASAPFTLGKDNVPVASGLRSSVVNAWHFQGPSNATFAWLYKTYAGAYYLQLAKNTDPQAVASMQLPHRFLNRPGAYSNFVPSALNAPELVDIENTLLAHRIVRVACFDTDLRMKERP